MFLFHPCTGEGQWDSRLKKDHGIILGIPCNSENVGTRKPFLFFKKKRSKRNDLNIDRRLQQTFQRRHRDSWWSHEKMLTTDPRKMPVKATIKYHLTPSRMTVSKKTTNHQCWRGCGKSAKSPRHTRAVGPLLSWGRHRALWLSYPAGLAAGWSNSKPETSRLSSFLPTLRYSPFPSGQHLTCITNLSQLNISQEKWHTYLKQMRRSHWAPKPPICSRVDYCVCS